MHDDFPAAIVGSLISATILYVSSDDTSSADDDVLQWCGANDCPDNPGNTTSAKPDTTTVSKHYNS